MPIQLLKSVWRLNQRQFIMKFNWLIFISKGLAFKSLELFWLSYMDIGHREELIVVWLYSQEITHILCNPQVPCGV
jgi:hypothetical protein